MAEVLQRPLRPHPEAMAELRDYARRRERAAPYPKSMCCLPEGTSPLRNPVGLVPGIWYKDKGYVLAALPGVPQEVWAMYEQSLRPKLKELIGEAALCHLYCQTVGVPESELAERLRSFEKKLPKDCKLAYLPRPAQVSLRLSTRARRVATAERRLKRLHLRLQEMLLDCLYATEDRTIEEVLAEQLKAKQLYLAVAESFTGGRLAEAFTLRAGASAYFAGGVIAYQNRLKEQLLNVPPRLITEQGAVSRPVVEAMAEGVQQHLGTDIGIATSGIAGPTGATEENPLGTTWIAVCYKGKLSSRCHHFASDRVGNIRYAVAYSLAMLWQKLRT